MVLRRFFHKKRQKDSCGEFRNWVWDFHYSSFRTFGLTQKDIFAKPSAEPNLFGICRGEKMKTEGQPKTQARRKRRERTCAGAERSRKTALIARSLRALALSPTLSPLFSQCNRTDLRSVEGVVIPSEV